MPGGRPHLSAPPHGAGPQGGLTAWWLNLQAHPDATVELVDGRRYVHARAAVGDERRRLWERWARYNKNLDRYATLRSRETAVVILEPAPRASPAEP